MATKDDRITQKRQSIVDAAIVAFRDEGYETTSMDRIAELAKASKRTVYNHFAGKEALFREVVRKLMDQMVALKEIEWDPNRPLEEQLTDFAHAKAAVVENPTWMSLLRVVIGVFIRSPELAQQTMAEAAKGDETLIRWLRAAHGAGRLSVPDAQLAATMFWSMTGGALFWPQLFKGPMKPDERERITKEVIAMFLSRYRSSAPPPSTT